MTSVVGLLSVGRIKMASVETAPVLPVLSEWPFIQPRCFENSSSLIIQISWPFLKLRKVGSSAEKCQQLRTSSLKKKKTKKKPNHLSPCSWFSDLVCWHQLKPRRIPTALSVHSGTWWPTRTSHRLMTHSEWSLLSTSTDTLPDLKPFHI